MKRRYGFSLIELLVVVAIIAVLAAILFPVFGQVRAAARKSSCTSNLHQLAMAFNQYFQDFDETFPPNGVTQFRGVADLDRLWISQIEPYVKSLGVLHCPADSITNAKRTFSGALPDEQDRPDLPRLSYGANWDMMSAAKSGRPEAKIATIRYSSQTLLVSDCTEPWAFGPVYVDESTGVRWSHIAFANGPPIVHDPTVYHGGRSGMGHERHGDGSNIAFMDGHVRFLHADQFVNRTDWHNYQPYSVQRPIMAPDGQPPD